MRSGWTVSSEAGDGLNGRFFALEDVDECLADVKSSVASHYGDGEWEEISPAGGNVPDGDMRNAWEYHVDESGDAVAVIQPTFGEAQAL